MANPHDEIREMGLRSAAASLSRVEAADPRIAAVMDAIGHYECEDCWYSCPKSSEGCCDDGQGDECNCGLEARAVRVLAAADACEAERNPNTTDEYEQVGWRDHFNGHLARRREYADEPPRWEPIYRKRKRRAVSSEDVHREDAE